MRKVTHRGRGVRFAFACNEMFASIRLSETLTPPHDVTPPSPFRLRLPVLLRGRRPRRHRSFQRNLDDGVADGFTTALTNITGTPYTIQTDGGGFDYQGLVSATGTATAAPASATAGVSISNLAGNNFTISTEFTIDASSSPSTSTVNTGLGLFGTTVNFSAGTEYRLLYQASGSSVGKLQWSRNGSASTASTASITPVIGTIYTLSVVGTYAGPNLTLVASLTDGTNSITNYTLTDASPLTGTFFGYRTAVNALNGTASINVDYDNLSISTIPEPSTWTALAFAALRRRR